MKIRLLLSLTCLLTFASQATFELQPKKNQQAQLRLLDSFLSLYHYKKSPLNDEKSAVILTRYLDYLDPGKYLFTEKDVKNYRRFSRSLDDAAHRGDLSIPFTIYNDFVNKRQAQIDWVLTRLQKPFKAHSDESLQLDRQKVAWASDEAALKVRWGKRLRNEWITLQLVKQSDSKAVATLIKRYRLMQKKLAKVQNDQVFQIYANAITSVYDPHTTYFSPRAAEEFEINMSLSLEGIGARLANEDEMVTIKELIAGGPAKRSGQLDRNDKILAVGQGTSGPMIDVVGWPRGDTVRLIRGKLGTTVRLRVEKAITHQVKEISLVRDRIRLEESAAKSAIKTIALHGKTYRIGVIDVPSFYLDFAAYSRGDKDYRSTTRDVKKLIDQLKKEKIDGLMIDLRGDGGGALVETVNMAGLFFDKGPVVQVRRANGQLTIQKDEDNKTYYDGPLAVLVNQGSASASEIFAGVIKDYQRGIILGEPTFGKGTVQTIIDLNRYLPDTRDKAGQLKMTVAMFYRVNGSSVQLQGVVPDIYIPNQESFVAAGESKEKNPLPWRHIDATEYQRFNAVAPYLAVLQKSYDKHNADDPVMKALLASLTWQREQAKDTLVPLDVRKRQARRQSHSDKNLEFHNALRKIYGYPLLSRDYWTKQDKDKTEDDIEQDKKYKIDTVLDIAATTTANYVHAVRGGQR